MLKIIFMGLWIMFLASCAPKSETANIKVSDVKANAQIVVNNIPDVWSASGRLAVEAEDERHNLSFEIKFNQQNYQLLLTGALGLGQVTIKADEKGLFVNNKAVNLNFKEWMNQEFGWYFPLHKLPAIVFSRPMNMKTDWQIKVASYQQIKQTVYPKIVRLKHSHQPIKIKLLFKEVN
ncbi:lipoprotein insertase outer membrane protein LolB [Candidatus Thioglobus sp.]